jgi:Tfp pilus assembly protein PilF
MISYCFYRVVFVSDGMKLCWAACLVLLGAAFGAAAAPYIPKDDSVVLETLPSKPTDPGAAELRQLRAAVASAPGDAGPAARLARRYFDLAMAEGDPRYVGYAEAALRAWPETAAAPAEMLILHGMLRQYRHDFPRAMADFDLALKIEPASTEARAWRAAILMVQADYPAARRECELLAEHATELHATACTGYIDATTGHARSAYERLAAALARRSDVNPEFHAWIQTRLAEMAWRFGDFAAAEKHFRKGLELGVDDNFLLAAYADFLLERGRAAEVVPLLKKWVRSDTLLLRLALAAKELKLAEGQKYTQTLGDRFSDAGLRGEKLHLQEEARYLLDLKGDARAALATAIENYRTQREPRDALVLIEAALAARDRAAAAPALQWLESTGFESARIHDAAAKLKALQP